MHLKMTYLHLDFFFYILIKLDKFSAKKRKKAVQENIEQRILSHFPREGYIFLNNWFHLIDNSLNKTNSGNAQTLRWEGVRKQHRLKYNI